MSDIIPGRYTAPIDESLEKETIIYIGIDYDTAYLLEVAVDLLIGAYVPETEVEMARTYRDLSHPNRQKALAAIDLLNGAIVDILNISRETQE